MKRTTKKGRSILGIEINTAEIRVVEVEGAWPEPRILRADAAPTPLDSISGDEIIQPELVGKALSTLLTQMGTRTRQAVISIPSGAVTTRLLDIPQIPESELLAVVQNEITHQNILPNHQGEFAYLRLDTGDRPQSRPRLLLMAAEERVLTGFNQTAGHAGVQLLGLEPGLVAMYRAASPSIYNSPPCLSVMIGATVSEVAIMDHGPIRVYRRIDLGSRQMMVDMDTQSQGNNAFKAMTPIPEIPRFNLDGSPVETEAWNPERATAGFTENMAVSSLTVELQRSLDYYKREYPDAPAINSIVIGTSQPELRPLADLLTERLHITAVVAPIPTAGMSDPALRTRLQEGDGLRFFRACGLAMQALSNAPAELPLFDLLGKRKEYRAPGAVNGRLAFSLAFSTLVLLIGSGNMYRVGQKANSLDHDLEHAMTERKQLSTYHGVALDQVRRQKELLNVLLPVGEPLPSVVDAVAKAVPPDTALGEISRDKPGVISLTGETTNETVLVQFLDSLRQVPACVKVSLDSLNRTADANSTATDKHDTLHYQITAQIRPMP